MTVNLRRRVNNSLLARARSYKIRESHPCAEDCRDGHSPLPFEFASPGLPQRGCDNRVQEAGRSFSVFSAYSLEGVRG